MLERINQAVEHHNRMIEAIEQGDSKQMVDLITDHWELSRDFLDKFVRPDPLPTEIKNVINE